MMMNGDTLAAALNKFAPPPNMAQQSPMMSYPQGMVMQRLPGRSEKTIRDPLPIIKVPETLVIRLREMSADDLKGRLVMFTERYQKAGSSSKKAFYQALMEVTVKLIKEK
jgi:hypothetical protein